MKKENIAFLVVTLSAFGILLGFSNGSDKNKDKDRNSSRIGNTSIEVTKISDLNKNIQFDANGTPNQTYGASYYTDNFDGANDTTALKARGYKVFYRGSGVQGAVATWFQGNSGVFAAFNGPSNGYVAANYNVVTGINNIDCWLVLPRQNVAVGDSIFFYNRSAQSFGPPPTYPDSIRVMYSAVGDSIPEAGTWVELGRFEGNVNGVWQRYGYGAPSAGTNARFAIRYAVVDGGPSGLNSDYTGFDDLTIEAPPIAADVGVESITDPVGTVVLPSGAILPTAVVKNFGTTMQSFNVTMTINPGGYSSTQTVSSLGGGATQSVDFSSHTPLAGIYTLRVYTQLGTDGNRLNDTLLTTYSAYNPHYGGVGAFNSSSYFYANSTSAASGAPSHPGYCRLDTAGSTSLVVNSIASITLTNGSLDDGHWGILLGTPRKIKFMGVTYDSVYIGTNGVLGFINFTPASSNWNPPASGLPSSGNGGNIRPAIYALWNDMNWGNTLQPVNRLSYRIDNVRNQLIVTYDRAPLFGGTASDYVTFQVCIELQADTAGAPNSNIIIGWSNSSTAVNLPMLAGLQNSTGSEWFQYGFYGGSVTTIGTLFDSLGAGVSVAIGPDETNLSGYCQAPSTVFPTFYQLSFPVDTSAIEFYLSDWGELLFVYETALHERYLNLSVLAPGVDDVWQIENAYLPSCKSIFIDTIYFAFDIGDSGIANNSIDYGISISADTLNSAPPISDNAELYYDSTFIEDGMFIIEESNDIDSNGRARKYKEWKVKDIANYYFIQDSVLENIEIDCSKKECLPAAVHYSLSYLKNINGIIVPNIIPDPISIEVLKKAHGNNSENWINGHDILKGKTTNTIPGKSNHLQRAGIPMRTREFRFSETQPGENESIMNTALAELKQGQDVELILRNKKTKKGHAVFLTGIKKESGGIWSIETIDDHKQGKKGGKREGKSIIKTNANNAHIKEGILHKYEIFSIAIECPSTNNAVASLSYPNDGAVLKSKNLILRGDTLTGKKYTWTIEISKDSLFTWDSLIVRIDSLLSPSYKFPEELKKNRKYYWRMSADNELTGDGMLSAHRSFEINNKSLNTKVGIEGQKSNNLYVKIISTIDTAVVKIAEIVSPYNTIDSALVLIENGTSDEVIYFSEAESKPYHIVIKHRNSIETWSSNPVQFSDTSIVNYDFTSAQSQAYGNNMILVSGSWCIFSGDVNQDGTVDATDVSTIDNDAANFVSGYVVTDLTGDDFVDGTDFAIGDNNAANFVGTITP